MSMRCSEPRCPQNQDDHQAQLICPDSCPQDDYGRIYSRCSCETPQPVRGAYCGLCGTRFANLRKSYPNSTRLSKVPASTDPDFAVAASPAFVAISTRDSTRIVSSTGSEESREIGPPENKQFRTAPRVGGCGSVLRTVVDGRVYHFGEMDKSWSKEFSLEDGESFRGIPCELDRDTIVAIVKSKDKTSLVVYDSYYCPKAISLMPELDYWTVAPDTIRAEGCQLHGAGSFWIITHDAQFAKAEVGDIGKLSNPNVIPPEALLHLGGTWDTFDLERVLQFDEESCGCRYLVALLGRDDRGRSFGKGVRSQWIQDCTKDTSKASWRSSISGGSVSRHRNVHGEPEYKITWQ